MPQKRDCDAKLEEWVASLCATLLFGWLLVLPTVARLRRGLPPSAAPILQNIFQLSVDSSQVPEAWKNANVTAIYKKGRRAEAANYRPISLTSVASKLLEHIIHSHVMKHLEKYNILTDSQHGFRAKRSTETQLIQTIHDISKSLDKKEIVDMAILDFTKAFDKVPHKRLIHKLNYYGITGSIATWIETFLTGRTQHWSSMEQHRHRP